MRVAATGFTMFRLSKDGQKVLLSFSGRVFILQRSTSEVRELPTGDGVIDPQLSNDGSRVAYVRGPDLYVIVTNAGAETALTRGGTELRTRGSAEFIAQEEFGRSRGHWWSPDGTTLLYEEVDNTKVDELFIGDPAHPERQPTRVRYPRAGRTNAETRFGFISVRRPHNLDQLRSNSLRLRRIGRVGTKLPAHAVGIRSAPNSRGAARS
jgi:dipeptidyl-peptidase-4